MSTQSFLYLDDDGAVQGPFQGSELLGWFADGYFQATTMLLPAADTDAAKVDRSAFKPFATFFPHTQKQQEAASKPAAVNTTEPAVIVEDEKDEEDTKPAADAAIAVIPVATTTTEAVDSAPAASASDAPAPESAAPAAAVAPVVAPAAPQTDWFYLDDTALERGPFPSSDMAAWFTAGFFTAATKVRTASEKEFKAFGERSAEQESFMKPSTAPAAVALVASSTAAAPVNIEDQFETDMMDDDDEHDDDEGAEGEEDTEQKATDKPDAAEEKKSDSVTAADSKDAPAAIQKLIAPALLAWFYVDADGKEQGPFTPASMLKWHRANFFAFNDTPLRRMDEETATPLSKRTTAPSFFSAILPRPPVARENRWYYLDARGTEQGPFTEVQMRGWWLGGFLKPSLRVRQVGEDESAFKQISERTGEHECAFTKGENPVPLLPTPGTQPTNMQPQQQPLQSQYPAPYLAPHPAHPQQPAPYGYAAPSAAPYWSGPGAAHPYAYAGHNPYGSPYGAPAAAHSSYHSAPYGAPPPPPPPRDRHWNASGDYAQSATFSGHRGRGRHVVGGAYAESRVPHDPLSTYAHPAALEQWQEEQNKRARR